MEYTRFIREDVLGNLKTLLPVLEEVAYRKTP
jgi:hypothetical protein